MQNPLRTRASVTSLSPILALVLVAGCDISTLVSEAPALSVSARPTPVPTPRLTVPVPTPEPTFLIYQVKPNDALEAIAKRYKTTLASIGYWNRTRYGSLDPDSSHFAPDSIRVGWLLRIHPGQTSDGDDGEPDVRPSEGPTEASSPGDSEAPTGSPSS